MSIAYAVVALVLAAMVAMSARLKLTRDQQAVDMIHRTVGVPLSWFPWLAAAELAGGAGVVVGIFVEPI